MLGFVISQTDKYLQGRPKGERKEIGQFFTSRETAAFMASMFDIPKTATLSILDPGAGSGILSAAIIGRLQTAENVKSISLTCYEDNPDILELLQSNLKYLEEHSTIPLTTRVVAKNYITEQSDFAMASGAGQGKYDMVIGNPPYKKMSKDSLEAKAMPHVCYGTPNLYFLFAAKSLENLRTEGEMVYIIPRSWTSGAYFKNFRKYLFHEGRLERVHIFVSRDKVFDRESVLQETMIIKIKKTQRRTEEVLITSSADNMDFGNVRFINVDYSAVVSGENMYVYLITEPDEVQVLSRINRMRNSMPDIGLRMKTGLIVDFRNRELLRDSPNGDEVPLFHSQHLKNGQTIFPAGRPSEYLLPVQAGLVQANKNYLFVKRFTSKEERRRLQCAVYIASCYSSYRYISTDNKINFIDSTSGKEMSECLVYGLYTLFNSTLYDRYYRILNGSTQVNSSEVNSMPVPERAVLEKIGKLLRESGDLSTKNCDRILGEYL